MNNTLNYELSNQLSSIETSATSYIKNQMLIYLDKTAKDFNSDICGFGRFALKNYLTIDDWYSSNWLENYKNSKFNVNVHLKIKSGNLFNKS